MTRRIYVQYLTDCLHIIVARPGHNVLWCVECDGPHYAVELRKLL